MRRFNVHLMCQRFPDQINLENTTISLGESLFLLAHLTFGYGLIFSVTAINIP